MTYTNPKVKNLVEHYKKTSLLSKVNTLLGWDLEVNLPPQAAAGRGEQIAYLTELVTDRWLEPSFRDNLAHVNTHLKDLPEEEKAIIRNLNWAAKFYHRVPKEVIVALARTTSDAFISWQQAKANNRFADFLPHLKKIIGLSQDIARHVGFDKNPYDALLDLYEPGLTAQFCQEMFATLQPGLSKLLQKIKKSKKFFENDQLVDGSFEYSQETQRKFFLFIIKLMGYDFSAGHVGQAAHPFETTLDRFDVRITTRYKRHDFRDSYAIAMHEAGHALYEQGVDPDYNLTPLEHGVSLGIHESQSRFWENQVGRSPIFIKFIAPLLRAFYPSELGEVDADHLAHIINQVKPSLIRTEADEVTYNLHVALRFELENNLINEKIEPKDLPEMWRVEMKKYLGVAPQTDSDGVLQDVHWAHASFGYFPTYTLGNLYAAQFTATMKKELDLDSLLSKGKLGSILAWQRDNIHQHGSRYWPDELIKRVTGKKLDTKPFLDYLNDKYSALYELKQS